MTAGERTDDALAEMWSRMRFVAVERVDLIIRVMCALVAGEDVGEERDAAVSAAHKLAGALGTYGLPEGSRITARAESALLADEPSASELDEIVAELLGLRSTLDQGSTS